MDGLPLVVALLIYFIPTIVGCRKRNAGSIFVLNLLLGWTLIGWAIALKWALTHEEQKPEATPDWDRHLDPDDASAYINRGSAYMDKGEYDRAIRDFDQAIKLVPNLAIAYLGRGIAYRNRGEYDRAIQDFDQILQLDPNYAEAYLSRGMVYADRGECDRARSDFYETLALGFDRATVEAALAQLPETLTSPSAPTPDTRHRDPDQAQSESMDTSRDAYTTMVSGADVERIVHFVLHELNLDLDDRLGDEYGYDDPVLICLDAVLAIRHKYKQFVVPRIARFQQEYPHIRSLSDLKQLIERYGHRRFGEQVWDYRYPVRVQTLELLASWFIAYRQEHGFADDLNAMRYWAQQPYKEPLSAYGVRGIGIATTQYLRMLAGADTVKPDVRIHQAIEDALGRSVTDAEAISLIEEAARRLGVGATTLDHAIWKVYSGNQAGQ